MTLEKQLSVTMANRPATLARMCGALGERNVNILGFMSIEHEGQNLVRIVVDNLPTALKVLAAIGYACTQEDVLSARVQNRPGTLAKVAKAMGDAGININYAYLGAEPGSRQPLLMLSVSDPEKGKSLLK